MKKIVLIIIAAGFVSILPACKKFLVSDSLTNNPKEFLFSSESEARKAVLSIYQSFITDPFTSRLSTSFQMNTDVEVGNVAGSKDGGRRDLWSYEPADNNSELASVWSEAYKAINRANECIDGLEQISLKAEPDNRQYKQLLGESKTLRAYWYSMLINHWGDVPFKVTPTKTGENFFLPKTGRDSILSYLIDDLIHIEPDMFWADQISPGGIEYVNREYTIGMIAKLSLIRGGYWLKPDMTMHDPLVDEPSVRRHYYEIANTYCKKLITLKPRALPEYSQVFMNQNKYISPVNSDVLFEVANPPLRGDIGYFLGVAVAGGNHPYGGTGIQMLLNPAYYFSFDTSDVRLQATCSVITYSYTNNVLIQNPVGISNISINKWNRLLVPTPLGQGSSKGTAINWPMMRYSDVLLMLAETENELNGAPTADAVAALKQVRQRAFPPAVWAEKVDQYIASKMNKEQFFNAIVDERSWEFGGEFVRKHDLIRWGLLAKKIAEVRTKIVELGQDAVSGVGTYGNYATTLYYKRNTDNSITFLNSYYKPAGTPPADYLSANWLGSLWNATTNLPADYADRQYRGITDRTGNTPVRYIFPIHSTVILASQGSLKNEYGY